MLKLIKGIFDVRAKWEHRGRASWPKLLLAFFADKAQNRSGRPEHGFPGVREIKNMLKGLHFLPLSQHIERVSQPWLLPYNKRRVPVNGHCVS